MPDLRVSRGAPAAVGLRGALVVGRLRWTRLSRCRKELLVVLEFLL